MVSFKKFLLKKSVVIVSGLHGDEPAGNSAALAFKDHPEVTLIRNINNTGKRRLGKKDLNRQFGKGTSKTADKILQLILKKKPKLVISLHEDFDGEGVYVYCSENLKNKLTQLLPQLKIKLVKSAYGDRAENGVITNSKAPWHNTLESVLTKLNIPYCTIETPTKWDYNKRVSIHQKIIDALIKNF